MPAPLLYFNQASLATPVTSIDHLKRKLQRFVDAAAAVIELRSNSVFFFEREVLNRVLFDQALFNLIACCAAKDKCRQILSGIRVLDEAQVAIARGFRDVRLNGVTSVSATLADLCASEHSIGWVLSVQEQGEVYDFNELAAERYDLDQAGELVGPVAFQIPNVSSCLHVNYWRDKLHDFGIAIAASARIDEIDGHPIVMYSGPAEHGPPHVHVLHNRNGGETFAKYRIDIFAREKGPPKYDSEMRIWVTRYREQLMRSWDRCQRGNKPFEITREGGD